VTKRREPPVFEDAANGVHIYGPTYRLPEEVGALENRLWLSEDEYLIMDDDSFEPLPPETVEDWRRRAPKAEKLYDLWHKLEGLADELPPELLERRRELFDRLRKLIWWAIERPLRRLEIRCVRAQFVSDGINQGMKREAAYDFAAMMLKGTVFECGRDMMKKAYNAVEREIPF